MRFLKPTSEFFFSNRLTCLVGGPLGLLHACIRRQGPDVSYPCSNQSWKPGFYDELDSSVEPALKLAIRTFVLSKQLIYFKLTDYLS